MSHQPPIHSMPPEVLIMVMRNLESAKELGALCRASRPISQVAHVHGEAILKDMVRRIIQAETLPDAFAACRASRISATWKRGCCDALAKEQAAFIDEYVRLRHTDPFPPRQRVPVAELKSVCRLHLLASGGIAAFREETFRNATHRLGLGSGDCDRPLSETERIRLYRAFFRYEICRRLFPHPISHPECEAGTAEDGSVRPNQRGLMLKFFGLFPQWELEEILTVREFLLRTVSGICNQLQKNLDLAASRLEPGSTERTRHLPRAGESLSGLRMSWGFCIHSSYPGTGSTSYAGVSYGPTPGLRWIVSQGLPLVHALMRASAPDRLYRLLRISGFATFGDLPETISIDSFPEAIYGQTEAAAPPLPAYSATDCEATDQPGAGWTWRVGHSPSRGNHVHNKDHACLFREMGYAFWDRRRLDDDWPLFNRRPTWAFSWSWRDKYRGIAFNPCKGPMEDEPVGVDVSGELAAWSLAELERGDGLLPDLAGDAVCENLEY